MKLVAFNLLIICIFCLSCKYIAITTKISAKDKKMLIKSAIILSIINTLILSIMMIFYTVSVDPIKNIEIVLSMTVVSFTGTFLVGINVFLNKNNLKFRL